VLISDCLFFVVEEGGGAEIHEGLLEVHFVQLILLSEVVVELLDLVRRVVFSFEFFFRESWVNLYYLGLIIEGDSISTPVNCTLL
jgi:spore cortex formation protein SpoVR/YcgB (stage V sporulation)